MGLRAIGSGGISSSLSAKKIKFYDKQKAGNMSSFSLEFPTGLPKNCWFVGVYRQNAPKLTDISHFKINNCDSQEITVIEKIQSSQYVVEYRFIAKITGINDNTAFYSDALVSNTGSTYRVYGEFIWD